jgi:hypothetical protein
LPRMNASGKQTAFFREADVFIQNIHGSGCLSG